MRRAWGVLCLAAAASPACSSSTRDVADGGGLEAGAGEGAAAATIDEDAEADAPDMTDGGGGDGEAGSDASFLPNNPCGTPALCGTPEIHPNGGFVAYGSTVTITGPANFPANGQIFFTTDFTPPSHSSTIYTGPIVVMQDVVIHAIAFASCVCLDSAVATASLELIPDGGIDGGDASPSPPLCFAPQFEPPGGLVPLGSSVTITWPGGEPPTGEIFFTTDGTPPLHASQLYTGPIQVTQSETIRAITFAPGFCADSTEGIAMFALSPPSNDAAVE